MSMQFTVRGQVMDTHGVRITAKQAKPRPKAEPKANYHNGWSVQGLEPGAIDKARAEAERHWKGWLAMSEGQRSDAIRKGRRSPPQWDEAAFAAKARRTKVRARPFECVSAASDAQRLAEAAGWTHVDIVELVKGSPPQSGLF